jgi:HSP20 family protein
MSQKKSTETASELLSEDFSNTDSPKDPNHVVYGINIRETEHKYELKLLAPGFKKGDFSITSDGALLTITAANEMKEKKEEDVFLRREFFLSALTRSFKMPEDIMTEHISARYRAGILVIDLKKGNRYQIGEKNIKVN